MKTPRAKRGAVRTVVLPLQDAAGRPPTLSPPSAPEAREIARAIRPHFRHYVEQYDTKKYWPFIYDRVRKEFRRPAHVTTATLRDALLWKYGHLGKPAIPPAHERLISQVQRGWAATVATLPTAPAAAFVALDRAFGGKTRFITVAFLLHLLHPREVPIIDQHNFRAVNALMREARPGWHPRKKPSRYADLTLVATFMKAVLAAWRRHALYPAPSARDLDKFLMMYGKAIKGAA